MNNFDQDNETNGSYILGDKEFLRLSSFIMSQFGIKLPSNKKMLLQCRLQKRIRALHHKTFKEYVDFVLSAGGQKEEVSKMIDAVSTNKTDFFREPVHFEFLLNEGLDKYLEVSGNKKLSIWSAGCSSGEEPYSIAMTLKEYATIRKFVDFNILATDISESVLQHAVVGIYTEDKTQSFPPDYKQKYLLKGKNEYEQKVRISSELRSKIEFRKFNLLSSDFSHLGMFDIVFCRNVLIYFEREVQQRILRLFCKCLKNYGFLFLGHSESITGYNSLPLKHIRPTIYTKVR
ncbi:MAG TPA: protein-glutamate O-methyltransferase CheR [Bacteroidales bacterium]|jgi:chemotaxis protein methyltransferase CheR|nr:protein-glutamate O-methyltransferase CheR [Bacteroidales bacterium]